MNHIDKKIPTTTQLTSAGIIDVLQRAVDKIGARLLIEPEWRCVGQITYPSGIRRYFKLSTMDLNTMGASAIARDKGYARLFLKAMGYPVPQGESFLAPHWAKKMRRPERGGISPAWAYAKTIGLPVFVKPNSLSRGVGVSKATSFAEFRKSASIAMKNDDVIIVEKAVVGRDYRVVVLDGQVISAYERIPLRVTGDGHSTIDELLNKKQLQFMVDGRGETPIDRHDHRLLGNLKKYKFALDSVLDADHTIQLFDNANLSAGGTSVDVTDTVHPEIKDLVKRIAHDMGLRLVGVDLIIQGDLTTPPEEGKYWIIEVNSAPGLDHYAAIGERQKQIVDDLYLRVVQAMERPQEDIAASRSILEYEGNKRTR